MPMTCTCGKVLPVADHGGSQRVQCPRCGEFLQMLELAGNSAPARWAEQDDERPRRRKPENSSPLILVVGLGSGALIVAAVTVLVVLLVKGSPHEAPATSATATYQYPAGIHTEKDVFQLSYSADGKFLATVSRDPASETTTKRIPNLIKVWNLATNEVVAQFPNDFFSNYQLAFSPNGKLLAVGGSGRVELWDLETKALRHKDALDGGNPRLGDRLLTFSPNGDLVVSVAEGLVCLMDVESGKVDRQPVYLNWTAGIAHVPGRPIIASATTLERRAGRGQLALYNYRTRQNTPTKELPILGSSIAFSRDGSVLAAASDTGSIRVLDTRTWDEMTSLQRFREKGHVQTRFQGYHSLVVNLDGRFVVGINGVPSQEQCEYWAIGGQVTRTILPSDNPTLYGCRYFALSPDDKTIAMVCGHHGVRFADVATGEEIRP
jgi:WD domain, G-beta repeat